jgi:hypothetical protein
VNLSFDERLMHEINPESLNLRLASGLFAGLREWNERRPKTIHMAEYFPSPHSV